MKTDDLIQALAAGLEPVRPARLNRLFLMAAVVTAAIGVVLMLGVRPDLGQAATGAAFWLKAVYTLSLAAASAWLVQRLGRPGTDIGRAGVALAAVVAVAALAGVIELLSLPANLRMDDLMGFTWQVCAINILKVSAFAAPLVFLSARRLAPTRPVLAGGALGVLTGAIAATAYGLHCPEATAAFVAVWYTLGVMAAGLIGTLIGRFALRW
ncbi:DUF1109 domain-containing protein [Brevundimonas sp.]|uniref:DUF1109 domain-containing protein n=1 Tax=Brevundimonas sp. TaxID=1871086 RepID=UPI002AB8DD19|nr:DUF1109 domain-containing protein [Brevundimonas sp.]MDZ4365312.1 DUF1109 domain-containing protein [Brevundimonas sp.]